MKKKAVAVIAAIMMITGSANTYADVNTAQVTAGLYKSATDNLIVVDTEEPMVYTFQAGNGWELNNIFNCSVGKPETPTPKGVFAIENKRNVLHSGETDEYFVCDFAYDWDGAWCFHSTLFQPGTVIPVDDRLGMWISAGCVRLTLEDSEWIWSNCEVGTRVVII